MGTFATNASSKSVNIWDDDTTLSDEGGYFAVTNPTPGTGIAQAVNASFSDTAVVAVIANTEVASNSNARSIYMRYLRLLLTQAPASATAWHYVLKLDNVNRYSSGGSTLHTSPGLSNVNPNSSQSSKAHIYFGAVTASAATADARLVGRGQWDSAIPVIGDQYMLHFGAPMIANDMLSGGTTAKNVTMTAPPLVIPPGWSLVLSMYGPSNATTPAAWELEAGWAERLPGL